MEQYDYDIYKKAIIDENRAIKKKIRKILMEKCPAIIEHCTISTDGYIDLTRSMNEESHISFVELHNVLKLNMDDAPRDIKNGGRFIYLLREALKIVETSSKEELEAKLAIYKL